LIKASANAQEQVAERYVIRHAGVSDGTKIDGIERTERIESSRRHHLSGSEVIFASPWKILK